MHGRHIRSPKIETLRTFVVFTFNKSVLSQMCTNHGRTQYTKVCKTSTMWIRISENLCKSSPLSTDRRVKGIQPFESLVQNSGPSRFLQSVVWSIHEALNTYGINKWTNEQVRILNTTNRISLPRGFCRVRPGLINIESLPPVSSTACHGFYLRWIYFFFVLHRISLAIYKVNAWWVGGGWCTFLFSGMWICQNHRK